MDEAKHEESVYSSEATQTTTAEWQPEARETAEVSSYAKSAPSWKQVVWTELKDLAVIRRTGKPFSRAEFTEYLKRTWRMWALVAAAIIGLVVAIAVVEQAYRWARNLQERRYERAVATLTPESLIRRCGQPFQDKTDDVYPILMRTMSYQPEMNETLVFRFSRTAEEKSDWVFLSMKDENGGESYETPDEQIVALSCLNSRK
jgi:hypothetical protein